jgi:cytochrome c peroxidase
MRSVKLLVILTAIITCVFLGSQKESVRAQSSNLDDQLAGLLAEHGFTGNIESTLEQKLGRRINTRLADIGRLLFFDSILSLNGDVSCASCHSPTAGFSDTLPISVGVGNNGIVGPGRRGPFNKRRAPRLINAAFFPKLMWDSRVVAFSGSPFNQDGGFSLPEPEGMSLSGLPHLLVAQSFIPTTTRAEMAGFTFNGSNEDMRNEVARRVHRVKKYKKLFKKVFSEVKAGAPVNYEMIARALAEFQFTLTFANAPIDRFARGERTAMTEDQKRGALLFFSRARCVVCHDVSGDSSEMFGNFFPRVVGVPQILPESVNVEFDGQDRDEDFGVERATGDPGDRYRFRIPPLRNVAVQPAFFHNGAFTTLESAIGHYMNVERSLTNYSADRVNAAFPGLNATVGPREPVLERLDPFLREPIELTQEEFRQLVEFVRNALLDPRARPENLRQLIPDSVPSRRPVPTFE